VPDDFTTLAKTIYRLCAELWPEGGGFYLEAGANNGVLQSNTLLLEENSQWSGLLVEPSSPAFKELLTTRPNNILINAALVDDSTVSQVAGTFTRGSLMGSMHRDLRYRDGIDMKRWSVEHLRRRAGLKPRIAISLVPAIRLEELLAQHQISTVDLMVLDVEGFELQVLRGLETVAPRLVIIETRSEDSQEIAELMLSRGYILCGNLSRFSVKTQPGWTGDHQDFCWCKAGDSEAIVATLNATREGR